MSCYLSKYEQIKYNAKKIAQYKKQDVYIAKANKLNKYIVIFSADELTRNYKIIEKIEYKCIENEDE